MTELHGIRIEEKLVQKKLRLGEHKRQNPTAFKGYPGLKHTAREICEYIPKCKIFVEPFAGLGRITKHVKAETVILNDLSDFAFRYLKKHFTAQITNLDYSEMFRLYDSKDTFFFIDPPWFDEIYEINPLTVNTKPCKEIYKELEELLPTLKGNWMIAGEQNGPLTKWRFNHKLITSRKNYLFGHKAKTYLVSNLPFINYHQTTFEADGQ